MEWSGRGQRTWAWAVAGAATGALCACVCVAVAAAVAERRRRQRRKGSALEAASAAAAEGVAEGGAVRDGFVGLVGHTPLVLLRSLSEQCGCAILGKAEFLNGGGSVKDRAARGLLEAAFAEGRLTHGDTVIEGTVGSTGIALALQARARGLCCRVFLPNDVAEEKGRLLEQLGVEVTRQPPVSIVDPLHYVNAARAAGDAPNALFADQFESLHNCDVHRRHTGPELLRQISLARLSLDAFVCGAGTGGTISGVALALRDAHCDARVFLADPQASGLYNKVNAGVMYAAEESEGTRRRHQTDTVVEGVGITRLTKNFLMGLEHIEEAFRCTDEEAVLMSRYLIRHEGLFLGTSSAVNCVAAMKVARRLGPGHTIVTMLCDGGGRYLSTFYNDDYLSSRGLPTGPEAFERAADLSFLEPIGPPPARP